MRNMESRWLAGVIPGSVFAGGQISDPDSSDWLQQPARSRWRVSLMSAGVYKLAGLNPHGRPKVEKQFKISII